MFAKAVRVVWSLDCYFRCFIRVRRVIRHFAQRVTVMTERTAKRLLGNPKPQHGAAARRSTLTSVPSVDLYGEVA